MRRALVWQIIRSAKNENKAKILEHAIAVVDETNPEKIFAARLGSPLVLGLGIGENYLASDPQALRPVTDRFIFLEDEEIVELTKSEISIFGHNRDSIERRAITLDARNDPADKGNFRHYMQKEICFVNLFSLS